MLLSSIKYQIKVSLNRRMFKIILVGLCGVVLINYFRNLYIYYGGDIVDLYHPMKLLLLAEDSSILKYYFLQCYPFLIVFPAAFSYMSDKKTGEINFLITRFGNRSYYTGKMISVFIVTFFAFSVPFLLEALLNRCVYPMNALGDLSNFGPYDEIYLEGVSNYFLPQFYCWSPELYAVFFIIIFGVFSGVLSVFVLAISMFEPKYRILLLLPAYLLLVGVALTGQKIAPGSDSFNYYYFLSIFHNGPKNGLFLLSFIIVIVLFSVIIVCKKSRKDCLQ